MSVSKEELKKLIEELENYSSSTTTLLSLYIPPDYPIGKVTQQLRDEFGTASNIKTKKTQVDVKGAISRAMDVLKNFNKTPENGLVVFSGNVSNDPGKDDFEVWVFEPPEPVPIRLYRTDKTFVLDPLKDMVQDKNVYGLLIVEKDYATIGLLRGKHIDVLEELQYQVPGKTRAGGQSARRYERLREQAVHEFFKRLGEHIKNQFLPYIESNLMKGIIVGGPAYAKEDFLNGDYLDYRIRDLIIGTVDTSYQGEYGLKELLERAEDLIKETEYFKERKLVEEFIKRIVKNSNLVTYGLRETKYASQIGAIDTLLLSEDEIELLKDFKEDIENYNYDVFIISNDTEEGQRFKQFGGIGALLRFPIQ